MLTPPALAYLIKFKALFKPGSTVLDFGDQRLFDAGHAGTIFNDFPELSKDLDDYEQVTLIYKMLGISRRHTLDYNKNADFQADLNYSLRCYKQLEDSFDLITNQGFSEHVFNQATTFEAIHHTCKPNGLMFHMIPCQGWADGGGWGHGFYSYHPNFIRHLANANNYTLIDLSLSPFSPNPKFYPFTPEEYSSLVNVHRVDQEYRHKNHLNDPIFSSLLVLLRMPSDKSYFQQPHE